MHQLKSKIYLLMEDDHTPINRYFQIFILSLIFINVVALVLETVDSLYLSYTLLFETINTVSVLIFSFEYLLRLWSCTTSPDYQGSIKGRIRYILSPFALIDLLAITPFYLPFIGIDLRQLRTVRLFRFFKIMRYSKTMDLFMKVFWKKRQELIITLIFLLFLLLFSSSVMYYAEHQAQPKNFSSIPASMWWAIATLTTVGYGDVYPVTGLGRFFASIIAVLGIGMFAMPTGILGAAFMEELEEQRSPKLLDCPHCGESLEADLDA